jgi:hypothetical protein
MKTYDDGASTHGMSPTWLSLKQLVRRWIDRERELISLRNAVGMMSESRRGDMEEYDSMADALRRARDRIHLLESHLKAKDGADAPA